MNCCSHSEAQILEFCRGFPGRSELVFHIRRGTDDFYRQVIRLQNLSDPTDQRS